MNKLQLKKIAKEIVSREWFHVIERPSSPVLGWDTNVSSINPNLSKILKKPIRVCGFLFFQNNLLVDIKDHRRINAILIKKYNEDKKDIKRLCKLMEKDCDTFRQEMDKAKVTSDFASINKFFRLHRKAIYHFRWVFNAVEVFEKITHRSSEEPLKQNFITKYHVGLNTIIREIRKQKKLINQIKKGKYDEIDKYPSIEKKLNRFLEKFNWMNMLHHQGNLIDKKNLIGEIKYNLHTRLPKNSRTKKCTTSENVWLLKYFIFLRTHLSESNAYADAKIRPVLEELGNKFGLEYDDITFLTEKEILEMINKNKLTLTRAQIKDRQKNGYACINLDGKYSFIEGKDLQTLNLFYKKYGKKEDLDNITELEGTTANRGFVKGIAKIVQNVKEFGKLDPGDILVANSTTPNYIPIMAKAAAFLTDEGGITNHAAIVSRELNKPCIIGLKHATKVFNDGDILEVDANKGTVKKLTSK